MQFNHDNMTGVWLAADLATLAGRVWSQDHATEILADHQIRRRSLTAAAAEDLREWALQLRTPFVVEDELERCDAINTLLDAGTARAYLTMHYGLRPHLHFAADEDDIVARVKAVTAGGLAIFTVESDGGRLGGCRRGGCPVVFVDTSRNGRRVYCSTTCGNYDAVRRHRATTH